MAKRKKKRTHIRVDEAAINPNAPKIPKCFVFRSGSVCKPVATLVKDMRKVMEPNTAIRLKERKNNKIKDFVDVSGQLGVTQFLIFTQTENGTNFRLARVPRGPTLCFKVHKYSLIKDVLSSQTNPKAARLEYNYSPLLVLNNFNEGEKHMKLMITMFQNMFPSININKIQLSDARRVVLFNYNSVTKTIDFRHYLVGLKPVGISKGIRKVITTSHPPNLHNYNDISEFILRNNGHISENEKEESEMEESSVTLAQDYIGKNNKKSDQRAIKLTEIGPRMELQLIKIQNGLCDGEVLFHEFDNDDVDDVDVDDDDVDDDVDDVDDDDDDVDDDDDGDGDGDGDNEEKEDLEDKIPIKKIKRNDYDRTGNFIKPKTSMKKINNKNKRKKH